MVKKWVQLMLVWCVVGLVYTQRAGATVVFDEQFAQPDGTELSTFDGWAAWAGVMQCQNEEAWAMGAGTAMYGQTSFTAPTVDNDSCIVVTARMIRSSIDPMQSPQQVDQLELWGPTGGAIDILFGAYDPGTLGLPIYVMCEDHDPNNVPHWPTRYEPLTRLEGNWAGLSRSECYFRLTIRWDRTYMDFMVPGITGLDTWQRVGRTVVSTLADNTTISNTGQVLVGNPLSYNLSHIGGTVSGMYILSPNGSTAFDNITIEVLPAPVILSSTVSGTVNLEGWAGVVDKLPLAPIRVRLSSGSTLVDTQWTQNGGGFSFDIAYDDNYKVTIEAGNYLTKTFEQYVPSGATINLGAITLKAGDCDGDNTITSTDLSILLLNMDAVGDTPF